MNKFVTLLICYFVNLFLATPAFAASAFDADYDVDYSVAPSGVTIVTQKVTLTNREANLYPKEYSVIIDSTQIQNVIARDGLGLIQPSISQSDGKTTIGVTFNEQVVGVGKQLSFTLRYDNLDIVSKNGTIWEIYVPGVEDDDSIKRYTVTLSVPPTFGPLAYRTPAPVDGRHWNKQQMISGGIALAYGTEQTFALTLGYYLENPRLTPVRQDIALPPDTAYQRVIIQSLDPLPKNVKRDADGNWIATYEQLGGAKQKITAKLLVTITLDRRKTWKDGINTVEYTKAQEFWESTHEDIQKLAAIHRSPRAIYDYVVGALSYSYDRVNQKPTRRGAIGGLAKAKESLCMEFTDLFIAIARAAGIPAREVVGFAYTTNARLRPLSLVADVLHAWPEYYDAERQVWVPVDPTWGNTTGGVDYFTKLDFNHIAFAIHGTSSTYPYPAGSYRQEAKIGKDVDVTFADHTPAISAGSLTTTIDLPKTASAGRVMTGTVRLSNRSGVSVDDADVAIEAAPYPFQFSASEQRIPPYAEFSYPVAIPVANYMARGNGRVSVTVNGQQIQHLFSVVPMYWLLLPVFGIMVGTLFFVWFFIHGHSAGKSQ